MKENLRTATLVVLSVAIAAILVVPVSRARPSFGDNPSVCHQRGSYLVSTTNSTSLQVDPGQTFQLQVHGEGPNVVVTFYSGARDNDEFTFAPAASVADGDANDANPAAGLVDATFTITAPSSGGPWQLMVLAREPSSATPDFAYLEFSVGGAVQASVPDRVFNHLNIYVGAVAIALLALGTLLYEISKERFTRTHGIMAGLSFVLTTINVAVVLPMTVQVTGSWTATTVDPSHLVHIVVGSVGMVAGIIAFITGLSGIRTKKPGYVALICWSFNFFYGLAYWGVGL